MFLTEYYGIQEPVGFVDIDVVADTKIFLDPFKVARAANGDPLAQAADSSIRHYSSLLSSYLASPDLSDRARGRRMLEHLNEPRETRLGMTRVGYDGKGIDKYHSDLVANALQYELEPLLLIGVFQWLGALPVYVRGIGADRMSDMTTAIVRAQLIDFTERKIAQYPQFSTFPNSLRQHTMKVWDVRKQQWMDRTARLPFAEGCPILLVPKSWTGQSLEVHGERFYHRSALTYLQLEEQLKAPQQAKIPKTVLEKQYPDRYLTNFKVTLEARENGINLLDQFLASLNHRLDAVENLGHQGLEAG